LVKRKLSEDSLEAVATSGEQTTPSEKLEGSGIQIRVLGPPDTIAELGKVFSEHGFVKVGERPERGFSGRNRAYFILDVEMFRISHGISVPQTQKATQF